MSLVETLEIIQRKFDSMLNEAWRGVSRTEMIVYKPEMLALNGLIVAAKEAAQRIEGPQVCE